MVFHREKNSRDSNQSWEFEAWNRLNAFDPFVHDAGHFFPRPNSTKFTPKTVAFRKGNGTPKISGKSRVKHVKHLARMM